MRQKGWKSQTLFYVGTNRDGWWSSEDIVKQPFDDAISLSQSLHPDAQALFLFDQSGNHNAYPSGALVASRMVLSERDFKLSDKYHFRDGRIYQDNDDEGWMQKMYVTLKKAKTKRFKGIRRILEKRNLWFENALHNPRKNG